MALHTIATPAGFTFTADDERERWLVSTPFDRFGRWSVVTDPAMISLLDHAEPMARVPEAKRADVDLIETTIARHAVEGHGR